MNIFMLACLFVLTTDFSTLTQAVSQGMNGAAHSGLVFSTSVSEWQSANEMLTGQHSVENPSVRVSSDVILVCFKLVN